MKPLYSNDRKAPRMRKGEFSKMVITKELFRKFLKDFPEYCKMTWEEFYQNWLEIAETVRDQAIRNPLGVKLGAYLGELKLQFLPYKFKTVDHITSEKEGQEIPYLNIPSKGKAVKIKWERRWAVKFNRILQYYAFDETRELNRVANQYMEKEGGHDKIRTARITIGGPSVWRQKFKK